MLHDNRSIYTNERTKTNKSVVNFIDIEDCQPPAGIFNVGDGQIKIS